MPPDRRKRPPSTDDRQDSVDSFLREAVEISEPAPDDVSLVPLGRGEVVADRFRIEQPAGRGGMGQVYKATDLSTGHHAALKVVGEQRESIRARFLREIAVLAELSHACIVRYLAHGTTSDGLPYLAMEWLEGEDLSVRLARARLTQDQCLAIVRRASEGLAVAHARGVVHRDIKPSNLFLCKGNPALTTVIDFGVARVEAGARGLTRPGTSVGTAGYMAPEQAAEAADVDARADVYALGCVLFECLTGRPAFVGRPAELLVKVLREPPPRVRDLRPDVTDDIDALVIRLLAKDRERRPKDAGELLRALEP